MGNEIFYTKSPHPLLPYPFRLTERLEHWAGAAPDRTFLAQRDEASQWRTLSYADTLRRVRAIAQALLHRRLNTQTPVLIVAGNSIEHALLGLGCMYAGVIYVPLSPSCLRELPEPATLRRVWDQVRPALVFAYDGKEAEGPLRGLLQRATELVTVKRPASLHATAFDDFEAALPCSSVDHTHAEVTGDSIVKILFTSGSTGISKGVITTQRMLCSNQQMIRSTMSFLADEPPVLCDWLPWNHVFGGSHNFGIALYNGGTLFIDEGKPTPSSFDATLANLRAVSTTAYLNVPRGYKMLVPALRADPAFQRHFFSRLKIIFCAGAGLDQSSWDEMQRLACEACGEEIVLMNALGSTESAPMALATNDAGAGAGRVGGPVAGVELKLVPVNDKLEARLRGPNITPGYWHDPERTAAAFDEEGFYKTGDALRFTSRERPEEGFCFDGRLSEDFKLSTGSWVNVGELRAKLLTELSGLAQEVVLAAPDRDFVAALIFAGPDAKREDTGRLLREFASRNRGLTRHVRRALLLNEQPAMRSDKGSLSLLAALQNCDALVEEVYGGSARTIDISIE